MVYVYCRICYVFFETSCSPWAFPVGEILHQQLINIFTEALKCVFTQGLLNDLLKGG